MASKNKEQAQYQNVEVEFINDETAIAHLTYTDFGVASVGILDLIDLPPLPEDSELVYNELVTEMFMKQLTDGVTV